MKLDKTTTNVEILGNIERNDVYIDSANTDIIVYILSHVNGK